MNTPSADEIFELALSGDHTALRAVQLWTARKIRNYAPQFEKYAASEHPEADGQCVSTVLTLTIAQAMGLPIYSDRDRFEIARRDAQCIVDEDAFKVDSPVWIADAALSASSPAVVASIDAFYAILNRQQERKHLGVAYKQIAKTYAEITANTLTNVEAHDAV